MSKFEATWVVFFSALTVATLAVTLTNVRLISHLDGRVTNLEAGKSGDERWICSHNERRYVTVMTAVSGAYQVYMDVCDEWKQKND